MDMKLEITSEKLEKIVESGLNWAGYIAINLIKNGETELLKKAEEDAVFLIMDGWMGASYNLTPKSIKLIELLEGVSKGVNEGVMKDDKYSHLYALLKAKMKELTGYEQKVL